MEETKLKRLKKKAQNENNNKFLISVCTDLADLYVKQERYDSAIEEYKVLAIIHESQGNQIEYATAHRGIGEAYIGLQDFENALAHQQIYLSVAVSLENHLEMQRAYANIGHTYLTCYLETQSDPKTKLEAAYKNFMKSLKIAESLKDINKLEKVDMMARLFSNLGLVKESQGDYNSAKELINRSIELCKKHDIYEQLSRGYISMASIFEKKCEYHEAISNYNHAINSLKNLKDNYGLMCTTLISKSEALIKLSDFHNAKQVLQKAYKLKTPNVKDKEAIEKSLRVVASMCYTEDKLVMSSHDNKEMKRLYEKMGDGACFLKNYSKAIEYYKLQLQYAEKSGARDKEIAEIYFSIAETYRDNGQYKEAIKFYEKEYELCKNWKDSLNTLSMIADTKEDAGGSLAEVKAVYETAFNNCRSAKNLKEERRMIARFIVYLRRQNHHAEAFHQEQYLNSLDQPDSEDESSSSDNDLNDTVTKVPVGDEINLDELTDNSDDSDIENYQTNVGNGPAVGKRRCKNFVVKKNAKGESQLHTACINGCLPVVKHLLEQGHPVNVRDNSGWLPLHEACNHGYMEIVQLLLEKGAAINDRGGIHCGGVTPLYDAANNGHLEIVDLLLDRGASVISKTDDGDTALNVLQAYHNNSKFVGDRYDLYQKLIERMSQAMEKAGHKVENRPILALPSSNRMDLDRTEMYNGDISTSDEDDSNEGHIEQSDDFEINIADEYRKVIGQLRKKSTEGKVKPSMTSSSLKRPALVRDDLEDWLEDDIGMASVKKRKLNLNTSLITTVNRRNSDSPKGSGKPKKNPSPKKRLSSNCSSDIDDFQEALDNDCFPSPKKTPEKRSSTDSNGSQTNQKKKNQVSLLDAGFSRNRDSTPPFSQTSMTSNKTSSLRRTNSFNTTKPIQTKMTSFSQARSFSESQNKQPQPSKTEPNKTLSNATEDLMVFVDVKIEGMTFRVPVLLSQIQTNTIGWLAEQASHKYSRKQYTRPTLELETTSGALLSDEDPLSLLFPLGAVQAEPVVGRIVKLSLPSLVERYKDICTHSGINPEVSLCRKLEEMSISLNLKSRGYLSKTLVPLCKALKHQNSLLDLDLSGNFLDMDCVRMLCDSLVSLVNLTSLNLRCTGLMSSHLADLVKVFKANTTPILEKLVHLDLSDNHLRDKSIQHLAQITQHLKLTSLKLSNVKLTRNAEFEFENTKLGLCELDCLDISENELDVEGVNLFISWTNVSKLKMLDVSGNHVSKQGIVGYLANAIEECGDNQLQNLNVSRSMVQENELYTLLRLCKKNSLTRINLAYNSNLTSISLRRILECPNLEEINLLGCDNILKYFENCSDYNIFKDWKDGNQKIIKLSCDSEEYRNQMSILANMFTEKYPGYSEERDRDFMQLSTRS